jgi:ATP-dependent helicase HrpB
MDWARAVKDRLTWSQRQRLDTHAPERLKLASGNTAAIAYAKGTPPVLPAQIQQLFGRETPRVAQGRVGLRVHLLAPNGRPQQVTDDLSGFWTGSYAAVRKELRGRYPKWSWPEKPTLADAQDRPKRRPR